MTTDLALYIHWPFCLSKCPYCDFNSHVRGRIDQAGYATAIRRELATEAARLGRRRLTSIFFGGGTPSLMDAATVAALIDDAMRWFDPVADLEITLEANPTSVEAERFAGFRAAGVNRVSVGIQSLDDTALRALGRQHSSAEALAALALAQRLFPRVSLDLIYARPGQTLPDWQSELRAALALGTDHLSLYQLTIEPATPFAGLHRQGKIVLPDDDLSVALYDATEEACAQAGLVAYEVSNYARPGSESRHNLAYWRYADYAGIGPGAHGRITVGGSLFATRRHRVPEIWADRVGVTGNGLTANDPVPPDDTAREALIMGLRLVEGVDRAWFARRTGRTVNEAVDADVLAQCLDAGYLVETADRLFATREGRIRLNALLSALVV